MNEQVPRSRDGIGAAASCAPDSPAIIDKERVLSFSELDDRHCRIAGLLTDANVGVGDRIAVLAANRREYLEVSIGALRFGVVPVPINALLRRDEIAYILENSGARILFTDRDEGIPPNLEKLVLFGPSYEDALSKVDPVEIGEHALTRPMHYTSGTTGRPKGVFVPVADGVEAARRSRAFRALWGISDKDRHLVCSPLGHSAPHRFALRTLEAGGVVILQPKFDAHEVLSVIQKERITSTFMVPTHLERVLPLGVGGKRRFDLSSMRLLAHAGAPIREETKLSTIRLFPGPSVWEFYGSTEGPATRISAAEWLVKRGSVGPAGAGAEIRVLNEAREPLHPGEVGQIWVQDPSAERFRYWNDPVKTASAWHEDAYSVGDLGWLDPDGYLFLTGRHDDTIISGGVNVYPQEVELVLLEHPEVAEAVVYGAPSEEWGQEVRAQVVLESRATLDPEELRLWLRARVASYKCPRAIEVLDSLERTATGKLQRPRNGA